MNILTHRGGIRRGFTLVELMIVISIISIILTVVFANYRKFNSKTVLLNTAYEVALAVRETQSLSMSASVRDTTIGADKPYGIYFKKSATLAGTYTIFVDTSPNTPNKKWDASDTTVKTVTLGNGISIYDVTFDGATQPRADITFIRPHLKSTFSPAAVTDATGVKLELRNKNGDKQFVNISKSGRVFITAS